ncbi:MAG: chemotaxis protein CheB [Geminicoccaceae bacterium]
MDDILCDAERQLDQSALYWVGIGASAGGLEALRELGRHLPEDANATYIVTQHMAPQHKSMMSELVGRETSLPVLDIVDGMEPEANHIYITPPNQDLAVEGNTLRLYEPSKEPGAPKPSVNRFFRSLATELGERAIGVILSGTGSDGAYGIQAIRAAGGITIAQDEGTAKYDGMPNAAIESGCVDLVMPPADIGVKFGQIIQAPRNLETLKHTWNSGDDLSDLMHLLLARTRVDFRDYKPATVRRRIDRRMATLRLTKLEEYVDHVRGHGDEVDALFRDLLISVTSFFRDAGEFETLKRHLEEMVAAQKDEQKRLRIWVAACATGEEAYSIAILAAEAMGGFPKIAKNGLQVFATDIDDAAIDHARRGLYPEAALHDLPAAYAERYFHRVKDKFQVAKRLREAVMFSYHDVTRDPPFRNINVVSCRNLLIYFRQSLQERVFSRFHYALTSDGLMFLGKSESVPGSSSLFRSVGDDRRVFQKRSAVNPAQVEQLEYRPPFRTRQPAEVQRSDDRYGPDMAAMFDALVKSIGPNCLLATPDLQLRRAYGDVSRYIALAEGDLRMTVTSMLRPDYGDEVRTLITACQRQLETRFGVVRTDPVDPSRREQIRVYPVYDESRSEHFFLIVFAGWHEQVIDGEAIEEAPESARQRIIDLERALSVTRESLQQANEELETSNEELQALNEELQSSNEELQSSNEELETSNEELQSTNEELTTVNEELHINAQELNSVNQDLDSILSRVGTPFIVVDKDLAITRCSAEAERFFGIEEPKSRPHVSVCKLPAGFPRLADLIVEVLETDQAIDRHVVGERESANLAIATYKDTKGQVIGVVVLISLTSEISQVQQELQLLLDHVPAGIMVRSKSGEILRINQHSAQILNAPIDQLEGRNIGDFGVPEALLREDREVIETGKPMLNVVHELTSAKGRPVWIRLDRVPFPNPETGETCVYSMAQNVTDIYAAERALRLSEERFDLAVKGSGVGIWDWDLENGTFFWSARCLEILGIAGDSLVGGPDAFWDLLHPDDRDRVKAAREAHFERREPYDVHFRVRRTDGTYRWIESRGQALRDSQGKATRFLGSADDITQRRQDEVALRVKTEQMALAEKMGGIGHWRVDLNDNSVFWSDQVYVIHGETSESHTPDLESGINFYHPDDREMVRKCVEEGIENGKPFEFEARLVRRSGEERIVQSICYTEKDHDGTITALFGVISDITERREQERERERTLDELFRSNAELSRFSFVCSHDLKEPVRTLNNMAELLLDDEAELDESERRDLLNRIRKNSKRLAGIIESLLAFSRIDGKLTIESVDLDEIVTEIRENLNAAIDDAEATIDVASLPTIQGAKVHFRQLFQNLLSNALKFGASGDCRIVITCKDEGEAWLISIDDNGPGVPEGSRDEIFDVFKRLHRADEVPGTGLGLAICKKILKQYYGNIRCEQSELGGASMKMSLPKENA